MTNFEKWKQTATAKVIAGIIKCDYCPAWHNPGHCSLRKGGPGCQKHFAAWATAEVGDE